MNKSEESIQRVNLKLQQLIKNYQLLQKDCDRQSRLISDLQHEKDRLEKKLSVMDLQVNVLRSAAGQLSGTEKKEFEKHINQYIRDIDKCISMLSE